jgi:hypothetical protein
MALITNSLTTYGVTTDREDLSDIIYRIAPVDTPLMSRVPKFTATAVTHEWSTQALAAISSTNAVFEGDELSRAAVTAPVRRKNVCQISRKDATVSGTQSAVDMAGSNDEFDRQIMVKGLELRRDMENILLGNTGRVDGNATTARTLRSFNAWFSGNTQRATGTVTGTDSTTETTAAIDASGTGYTPVTLTETILKKGILDAFTDGGSPDMILCGPYNKQLISGFTGRASARQNIADNTILAAADLYASDFGVLKVVPNRSQRERDLYIIDPTKVGVAFLKGRQFVKQETGRIGDARTAFIIAEYTLAMLHPDAHAGVFDLKTS